MPVLAPEPTGQDLDPVTRYIREQQRLQTPVARFSRHHGSDTDTAAPASPPSAGDRAWRDLIPLSRPAPGERLAFEVDLDLCTGCKACVTACHQLNGLDKNEAWRDVGLLLGDNPFEPWQQTVTTACHHCEKPACLLGCPVHAYEKDPATGIVLHLDDQCIGCQYCVFKCPYDVPKFNARLGIVRKCDMCHGRLAAGEAPACAQACPNEAIRIITVTSDPPGAGEPPAFLPTAPDPELTRPTTRYRSRRRRPTAIRPADAHHPRPQHAHWPLVFMLLLTQAAFGLLAAAALLPALAPPLLIAAAGCGVLGVNLAALHLGRPLRAWRAFLGWRTSWLSREIIVFGAWLPLLALAALWPWLETASLLPVREEAFRSGSLAAALVAGTGGVFCSVMVYADTGRQFWRFPWTAGRFFGSAAVLGSVLTLAIITFVSDSRMHTAGLAAIALAALAAKLGLEARHHSILRSAAAPLPARLSARIQAEFSRVALLLRAAALPGAACLLLIFLGSPGTQFLALIAALALFTGEIGERWLFFRAVDAPKMPGGLAP